MMFNEVPSMDRFTKASKAGFKGVEFLFPYDYSPDEVADQLHKNDLQMVLFNMKPGNWQAGERGLACIPGRESEFKDNLAPVLEYARDLDCRQVHMLAGIHDKEIPHQQARETFINNLRVAARTCSENDITVLIEPINQQDMPGYFLSTQAKAMELIAEANEPNIALQMDFYHCQISEGNLAGHLRDNINCISHIQIAGSPDRHEPDNGEINYPFLFDLIDSLGYQGWIGCEYRPKDNTEAGLSWASEYLGVLALGN